MSDDLNKIASPRGEARSMTPLSPTSVNASYPEGEGANWMGPRQPLRPLAPREVAGRALDYEVGYNLTTTPRAFEQISFASLRSLAESYDPVRIIIQRRRDQITRLNWGIRPKHEGEGRRPTSAQLSPEMRDKIREATALFRRPEESLSFRQFVGALIEDILVIDAPSIYCARDPYGNLVGLEYVDGSTIRRIIG